MNVLFKVHKLNDNGLQRAREIATEFDNMVTWLGPICGESREFSIVKTKLEEACFFAKKAMANRPENQEAQ